VIALVTRWPPFEQNPFGSQSLVVVGAREGRSVIQGSWDRELPSAVLWFVGFIFCGLEYLQALCFPRQNYKCLVFSVLYNSAPFLSQGTQSILEEESHIKDVLSRIVVEMIKREWPQHWPDMLKELDTLSKQGVWNTPVCSLLFAHSMGFGLPSPWGKPNSLMVRWDRLMMASKVPVRLSYSRTWF